MISKLNLIIVLITLSISTVSFSQSKDVKRLFNLFEDKKWNEFENKFTEITKEFNLSFSPVYEFNGPVDDDKFDFLKSTSTSFQTKKHHLNEFSLEVLIMTQMRILKTIETKDSAKYLSMLPDVRNMYLLCIYDVENTCSNCPYTKMILDLSLNEMNCLQLVRKCDSLCIEYVNQKQRSNSSDLISLRSKLNCSKLYPKIDNYIQTKEEDEAVASKDLKTLVEVIKKYPKSTRRPELLVHYDDFYFDYAKSQGTIEAYKSYMIDLPNGKYINQVKTNLEDLHFGKAINSSDLKYIKQVIATYPTNEKVNQLQYHLEELEFVNANKQGENGLKIFIQTYPKSAFAIKAKESLVESSIQQAITSNDILTLQSIILAYPNHSKINEMKTLVKDAESRALKLNIYKGSYKTGNSTYQYYENAEGDRILHGNFEFSGKFIENFDWNASEDVEWVDLNCLRVINFPVLINFFQDQPASWSQKDFELVNFLGRTEGKFIGTYVHGKKHGNWKFIYENEALTETLIYILKNDSLVSAIYSIQFKHRKINSASPEIIKNSIKITPLGFEGDFYKTDSEKYYLKGKYLNGKRVGIWSQFDPDYLPSKYLRTYYNRETDETINYYVPEGEYDEDPNAYLEDESFPAQITIEYVEGKLASIKIRNQETGELYVPEK